MILVTGAAGHLGANLVRRLLTEGAPLRVLLRADDDRDTVAGLPVQTVMGDLCDASGMRAAVAGCTEVYHCAAEVSTVNRGHASLFASNVLGTRTVLRAAADAGVRKVVVTGSFSATGHMPGQPSNEDVPFNPLERHLPYGHTKAAVEHECLKACAAGLPVVIAVSTAILGPWDFRPSRMGQVLIRFAQGRLLAYVPGGFEFVAADDIVQGHILAMRHGRPGRKYIFATHYMTFDELIDLFARVTGQTMRPRRLPAWLMTMAAGVAERVLPAVAPRREQLLTTAAIRILSQGRRADTRRAREELGFSPGSIEAAVRSAYAWFLARGLVTAR